MPLLDCIYDLSMSIMKCYIVFEVDILFCKVALLESIIYSCVQTSAA